MKLEVAAIDAKRFATVEPTLPFFQIHSPDGTVVQSGERRKQRKKRRGLDATLKMFAMKVVQIDVVW